MEKAKPKSSSEPTKVVNAPKKSKIIHNKHVSQWQVDKLNEWDGNNMVSLVAKPQSFRESLILSDAKIADNAQTLDLCMFLLSKHNISEWDGKGNLLNLYERLQYFFEGQLNQLSKIESTEQDNSSDKD